MHVSPRQEQILSLITEGQCDKQIARELNMSARTVDSHLQRLYDKYNVHSRAAIVAKWILEGGVPHEVSREEHDTALTAPAPNGSSRPPVAADG